MGRFARLTGFVRPYRGAFLLCFVAAVAASALDGFTFALLLPFFRTLFGLSAAAAEAPTAVERLLEGVLAPFVTGRDRGDTLRAIVLVLLAGIVVKNVAVYVSAYLGAHLQESVSRDLRTGLYAHIQRLGLGFFQRTRGGQIASRVLVDAEQARLIVGQGLASFIQNALLVVVYVVILFALSWRLALIALLVAPAVALGLNPLLRGIRRRTRAALDDRDELAAVMSETVSGARLVKTHGAEAYERARFGGAAQRYWHGILSAQRLAIMASPLSETLGAAVVVLLLFAGTMAVADPGVIRAEVFVTFFAVTVRLLPPVKALSQFPTSAEQWLAAAQRIFDVLDITPDDVDPPGTPALPPFSAEIVFDGVWFAYESDDWVLEGVDLTVRRGEVVAIVGPSGAGKSTLIDLLPRFIEPRRGRVLIDGRNIAGYSRDSVRAQLGVVSQETVIFHDTVRANIAYGDRAGASPGDVEAAARAANAHGFISRLPLGYDTVLGERGTRLSGGERQRIALARVLLRDPPVLVLDEATSALDAESDQLIREALDRVLEDRTVLVIAHRLSTVARADRIAVLDRGKIVELGRHDELVGAGGLYQRLHALEFAWRA